MPSPRKSKGQDSTEQGFVMLFESGRNCRRSKFLLLRTVFLWLFLLLLVPQALAEHYPGEGNICEQPASDASQQLHRGQKECNQEVITCQCSDLYEIELKLKQLPERGDAEVEDLFTSEEVIHHSTNESEGTDQPTSCIVSYYVALQ